MNPSFADNLAEVHRHIQSACVRAGRAPDAVRVLAVSKTHGPERVQEASACGLTFFGESRVQEAKQKIPLCPTALTWHFIGHLQTNKVRDAVNLFGLIQAVDSLKLTPRIRNRIEQVTIVGNVAMHHLLARLPVDNLAVMPFQPWKSEPIDDAAYLMGGIFPEHVHVTLPAMIGGFVGSDALACLAYFSYDNPPGPLAAIDLGTNGEVLVTDGKRILTASTAAGPAFEGVFISCGTRAVDGAIVKAQLEEGTLVFDTIGGQPPVGLTGSGLLSLVHLLVKAGVIEKNGRIASQSPYPEIKIEQDTQGARRILLTPDGRLGLNQWDIRELQKAKGAIRAAFETLMEKLAIQPENLAKVILTGSFGGQVDIDAAVELGMLPPVDRSVIETVANGAGLGAATFLTAQGFARGTALARQAEQIDLDLDEHFIPRYVAAMTLARDGSLEIRDALS